MIYVHDNKTAHQAIEACKAQGLSVEEGHRKVFHFDGPNHVIVPSIEEGDHCFHFNMNDLREVAFDLAWAE